MTYGLTNTHSSDKYRILISIWHQKTYGALRDLNNITSELHVQQTELLETEVSLTSKYRTCFDRSFVKKRKQIFFAVLRKITGAIPIVIFERARKKLIPNNIILAYYFNLGFVHWWENKERQKRAAFRLRKFTFFLKHSVGTCLKGHNRTVFVF